MRNLALSYTNQDIEGFKALLHERYVYIISETKTRSREFTINAVNFMFDTATTIRAEISGGEWQLVKTFAGEDCPGCWSTNREFIMRIATPDLQEKEIRTQVRFIVAPVEASGMVKYKLRGEASPELDPETAKDIK